MAFPRKDRGEVGVSRRSKENMSRQRLSELFIVLNGGGEVLCELSVVGSIKGGKEFRIVRLPSTQPISRLKEKGVSLLFRLEFGR
jgi:hypothetical protein